MSKLHRQQITGNTDWFGCYQEQADKAGMNLSEWITETCNAALTKQQQKRLSERRQRGRPRNQENEY